MFTNPYGSLVIPTSFVCPLLFLLSNFLLKYFILEPNKTQCSVCLKFIHRNTISRHMKNLHGDSPRVQCQHCEKICKNLTSYKDHLRRDHSIYQSNWWQLKKNSNKNTWERTTASSSPIESQVTFAGVWQQQGKIQCSYCDKAFHKDSLNRHVKNIHGPAQSFQCQYCQKNFKNSDSLQDHQSRVCKYVPGKRHSEYANWNKDQSFFPSLTLPVSSRGSGPVQVLWKVASQKGVKEAREGCAWEWGGCVWIWASVSSLWKTL